jgi:hypothetical protein
VKKLWEYLTTYCYLPRLANYGVLQDTIIRGVDSQDFFALAGGYEGNRYIDLKYNKNVFSINPSDLLVKTEVALKQLVDTPVTPVTPPTNPVDPPVSPVSPHVDSENPPAKPMNTHFYMCYVLMI